MSSVRTRWRQLALLSFLLLPLTARAQHADRVEPVVVTGAALPAWSGARGSDVRAYAWDGASGWIPIPVQVDDKVLRTFPADPVGGVPEHRELTFDFDDVEDGTLDDDDDVVLLPWTMGPQAPASAWKGDGTTRHRVEALDPITGLVGHAYLFLAPDEPEAPGDLVTGSENAQGTFSTLDYSVGYEGRWLLTSMSAGIGVGGDGTDLVDRLKGRAGQAVDLAETEDLWEATSTLLGTIDGPVRAAREVLGAASGRHVTHVDVFSPRCWERTSYLRVHVMENIWLYWDLDPAALPAMYADPAGAGLVLDGVPHPHSDQPPEWMLATSPHGSFFFWYEELSTMPRGPTGSEPRLTYHRDDAAFDDLSGEHPGAHGNFGIHLQDLGDTNATPYESRMVVVPLAPDASPSTLPWPGRFREPLLVATYAESRPSLLPDADSDGIDDSADNCPAVANFTQRDGDGDGRGDACDACPLSALDDADGDGACEDADNCAGLPNATQSDADADGRGDACDACPLSALDDADGDGTCEDADNCSGVSNATQSDADADGRGDACDACPLTALDDADGDGACEDADNCAGLPNATQSDADADGRGDACDACPMSALDDADGDGTCEDADNCPGVSNATQSDADADGRGDACDACPLSALDDADGDGTCEDADNCPGLSNTTQSDADADGLGDACDDASAILLFVTRSGSDVHLRWVGGDGLDVVQRSDSGPRTRTPLGTSATHAYLDAGVAGDGRLLFYVVEP